MAGQRAPMIDIFEGDAIERGSDSAGGGSWWSDVSEGQVPLSGPDVGVRPLGREAPPEKPAGSSQAE